MHASLANLRYLDAHGGSHLALAFVSRERHRRNYDRRSAGQREHSVAARGGRVYLDPFRNAFGQTVVAPYSVRRREKAPISTPLDWSEVTPTLIPSDFNLGNFLVRINRIDPWSDFFENRQALEDAAQLLKWL